VKYAWIAKQRGTWPTRVMCTLLEVSSSGFYEWLGRGPSARSLEDTRLTRGIRESFQLSDRTYGSPRVWRDLREAGERCGRHRVARLMQLAQMKARAKRRRLPGDDSIRLEHNIAENHLQREFEADSPNKKWVADFTYVWTAQGWLYVAAVMDL